MKAMKDMYVFNNKERESLSDAQPLTHALWNFYHHSPPATTKNETDPTATSLRKVMRRLVKGLDGDSFQEKRKKNIYFDLI